MNGDPIIIGDVILDAALAGDAETVSIAPADDRYAVTVRRGGETLATSLLAPTIAAQVIARLGFVCHADPTSRMGSTGRTRVRANNLVRDVVMTIRAGAPASAELHILPRAVAGATDVAIGDRIGHYRVTGTIGAGGMGSVYEVVHEKLGRRHALKVLQNWVRDRDRDSIERFLHEAQAAARIKNPHIVDVFDFGYLPDGRPYFVMELLGGSSLAAVIEDRGALALRSVLVFARQLAHALTAAHERDVVHADVTPSNLLLADDHVTLIDFGLAQLRADASEARSDMVSGTPSYLAPERIAGCAATELSDQYAFGAVLFTMIAGHPPYLGVDAEEICIAHLQAPIPGVTSPHGDVPAELEAVVARCLAKSPAERFPSMRDVANALEDIDQ